MVAEIPQDAIKKPRKQNRREQANKRQTVDARREGELLDRVHQTFWGSSITSYPSLFERRGGFTL
jgi:hypothetical protein